MSTFAKILRLLQEQKERQQSKVLEQVEDLTRALAATEAKYTPPEWPE